MTLAVFCSCVSETWYLLGVEDRVRCTMLDQALYSRHDTMGITANVDVICVDVPRLEQDRRSDDLQWRLAIDSETEKSLKGVLVSSVPQNTGTICHFWHTINEYEICSVLSAVHSRSIRET